MPSDDLLISMESLRELVWGLELREFAAAVVIDLSRHRIESDGVTHLLSDREFLVVRELADARGRPVPRPRLARILAGTGTGTGAGAGAVDVRRVDAAVSRLRRKLAPRGHLIASHYRLGYSLAVSPDLAVREFEAP